MQKGGLLIFLMSLILLGCDNELDLTTDWQDIPVVYGILSPVDTAHYIRVEKAFVDPEKSALEIARISDSLYYDEVEVSLLHVNSGDRMTLTEVDGTDEGYPREDGNFATTPNILYKLDGNALELIGGDRYRLSVIRGEPLPPVEAEIVLVRNPGIRKATIPANLRFDYSNLFRVRWTDVDAAFYDVKLLFYYKEWLTSSPEEKTDKILTWKYAHRVKNDEYAVLGLDFYTYLGSQLEKDPQLERSFTKIDIVVQSAGDEIEELIRISQANTGITGVGDFPIYSNIEGGRGLFSSINEDRLEGLQLQSMTLDSLRNGIYTRDLNFQ